MPLNSINTNAQSLIALQSLNTTNEQLSTTQKRVSTGLRVSDARDDGGAFAVAQSVRSDMAGVVAVNEQLGGVKGILETTFAALSVVSDTMKQLRATLTRLADGAISVEQRNTYEEQYKLLAAQVSSFVDDAFYNGRTLLSTSALSGGGDITAIRNETGGLFTIQAVDGAGIKLDPDAFPPKPSTAAFETAIKDELAVGFEVADPVAWAAKTAAQKATDINTAFAALTPAQKQTKFDDNKVRSELAIEFDVANAAAWAAKTPTQRAADRDAAIKDQLGVELEAADPVAWAAKSAAQKTTDINTAFAALTTDAQKQTKFDAYTTRTKTTATNTAFTALTPAQKEARIDARVLAERIAEAKSMIQTDGEFNSKQTEISKALNRFGAAMAFVENQIGYNSKKVDSMTSGMGALVDADLARESSTLEALKVRQQLGVQTLGLANQGPQVLLGLFR
ncbi:MAG: flagellin [Roseomonas sp.]|nr:flagellin [Roseomonas sp.]